jgi:sugar lactone lactonase YvrE
MEYARSGHQATLLLDGRVLVTGGAGKSGEAISRAEVFSPATGAWAFTGNTTTPRLDHAAALLLDGRVLIVGGASSSSSCSSDSTAEIYDPATGTWSTAAPLPIVVGGGASALCLLDGRVLVAGGGNRCGEVFNTAALFDPSTNTWSATMPMRTARQSHRAVLLGDGRVLVASGGSAIDGEPIDAEVFDPVSASWAATEGPFSAWTRSQLIAPEPGRTLATATVLASGKVLAAGGRDASRTLLAAAEVFDPVAGTWMPAGGLTIPRASHSATRLANGIGVLFTGGIDALGPSASAEIFHPVAELPCESSVPGIAMMGSATSLATNSQDHLYVSFSVTNARSRIFEYELRRSDGEPQAARLYGNPKQFGAEFGGMVHTLRIDKSDNVWAVIEETNTILKFNPQGRVLMRLFLAADSSDVVDELLSDTPPLSQRYRFNRPTDVGWDASGNIFVADGHGNSRVVKYDKGGRFIAAVGSPGVVPGKMNTPHSLVVDAGGNVYVADGRNARIQVFDNSLNLRAVYDTVGNPWALCITEGAHQYLYSASNLFRRDRLPRGLFTGEIYKMELDGTVLGRVGSADTALPGVRPSNLLQCRQASRIIAAGPGFASILTLHP